MAEAVFDCRIDLDHLWVEDGPTVPLHALVDIDDSDLTQVSHGIVVESGVRRKHLDFELVDVVRIVLRRLLRDAHRERMLVPDVVLDDDTGFVRSPLFAPSLGIQSAT